jgi:PhnB protein
MPTLNPYLTFNGDCRDAMNFYKEILGGDLEIMTVADSPLAGQMPSVYNEQVLHSSLKTAELEIMATDMQPEAMSSGNDVHLCVSCKTEKEANELYERLAAGGKPRQPMTRMFFGVLGDLVDKFGKRWMVVGDTQQPA